MKMMICAFIFVLLVGCSKSDEMTDAAATNLVERYSKPVDAAKAAADQVQQIRDAETAPQE